MKPHTVPPAVARLLQWVTRLENILLVVLLAAMVLLAAAQIVLRNSMNMNIAGSDQLLRLLVLWVAFMGAVAASREGKHIHVDAVVRWLPGRAHALARAVTDLFTLGVCAVLAYESARYLMNSYAAEEIAFAGVPVWIAASVLPLAFGLIGLRYGLRLYHHARQAAGRERME